MTPTTGASESVTPLQRIVTVMHRVEDYFLAFLLAVMLLLAFGQIVLRNLQSIVPATWVTSTIWIDPFSRHLVLWIGLFGAVIATREDRHITIDVVGKFVGKRAASGVRVVTDLFAAVICALVAYAGVKLVQSEMEYASTTFLNLPTWTMQIIIPISFGLIALRYARFFVIHLIAFITGNDPVGLPEPAMGQFFDLEAATVGLGAEDTDATLRVDLDSTHPASRPPDEKGSGDA